MKPEVMRVKKVIVFVMVFLSVVILAQIDLANFDITQFKGQFPLISLQRFMETDEFVSVEGVVYKIKAPKKFLTRAEVDSKLLNDSTFVGLLTISIDELRTYDGKNKPALVAVSGIVYDVSMSARWRSGVHQNRHNSGEELTHDIVKLSPHGIRLLSRVKPFGVLVFTPEQLVRFNGKDKNKAYVSAFGVVYDMSNSRTVRDGAHYGYPMGNELTYEIKQRPGHEELLKRVPAIGLLVFDEANLSKFDGKTVRASVQKQVYKAFIMVADRVYDVTDISDWREKLGLDEDEQPGKDYTMYFECELGETCSHDHPDPEVLRGFSIVGFRIL